MQDQGMMDQGNDDQNMQDDQQYGNANAAEQSQGMPSCEEEVKMLEQRIADLEKLLEESGIEVPEPSDDVPSEDVPGQDMQNEADKGQNNNQEKGQKQGLFKRFIGFLGLGGTEYLASEECPDGTCTDEEMQLNLCAEDCQYANAPQEGEAMPQGEMANVPPGEQGQEMPAEPIDDKMLCGDGTCDEYESSELCPEDCE